MRQSGDYVDYFEFDANEVTDLLEPAKNLITQIETIIAIQSNLSSDKGIK